jgi:Predicted AAA-ATPase
MEKTFNVTGTCFPNEHYMADVSEKIVQVKKLIDTGKYFIINRPRQYGKTTTFNTLSEILKNSNDYLVITISFEGIGDAVFLEEKKLSKIFIKLLHDMSKYYAPELTNWLKEAIERTDDLNTLSDTITELCEQTDKKVVLMIDEVDKSSNNQLFISFLAMLRNKYLTRHIIKTFHSVVLAGVHDVKSLKLKLRPDEEQKLNSPWNIATDFTIDMNLYPLEIKPMLEEYAHDKGIKMNTKKIAERLFYFTSGYPFLVSKLCKIVDETILPKRKSKKWTIQDIDAAALQLIGESNANFDSLTKNLENNPELYNLVYKVAVDNETFPFNVHDTMSNLGILYGIFTDKGGLKIHNLIYEQVIINFMALRLQRESKIDKEALTGIDYRNLDLSLNMERVLLRFQSFMREQYSKKDRDFLEHQGRLVFLAFMKPVLNGGGFDFKEPQVSEERRLDVAITYYNHKYVAELKIWRGQSAHEKGLVQLADYLQKQGLTEGYLIIFDHSAIKSWNSERTEVAGKNIFMVWV